jgi:hypothetical protein
VSEHAPTDKDDNTPPSLHVVRQHEVRDVK